MIGTTLIAAVLLAYVAEGNSCTIETSPTYGAPISSFEASTQTVASKPGCFNPRQALYERWPLLYQLHSQKCRFFCNKLNGVTPCQQNPVAPAASTPPVSAPVPVRAPVPIMEECPACAANACNQVRPEVLRFLYGSAVPSCPCCAR